MSESGKSKRQEDAESIVGKANAELLEAADQNLVGRSADDIDPNAVVERKHKSGDDEYEADDAAEEEESEEESEDESKGKPKGKPKDKEKDEEDEDGPPFGGAKSLADAEIFMVERANGAPILMDSLSVLGDVLTNIAGDEYGLAIRAELADWQTRLDAQVLKTLNSVQTMLDNGKEVTMPEETVVEEPQADVTEAEAAPVAAEVEAQPEAEADTGDHVLDPVYASLQASFDEALETPADEAVRLRMIQKPLEEFAAVIKANIGSDEAPVAEAPAAGGVTIEQIQQAIAVGVAPIAAEVEALKSASAVSVNPADPVRRALQTAALGEVGQGPPAELVIPEAEYSNQKSSHNVTPGIRAMVRRTVFGKGG